MEERNGSGALETVDITDFNIWFLHHFPKVNHTSHFLDLTPHLHLGAVASPNPFFPGQILFKLV
jgi:hypothetical protein